MATNAREYTKPLPLMESFAKEFYEHCRNGELRFQRCTGCGRCETACPIAGAAADDLGLRQVGLVRALAGYSLGQADIFRKAMGKKIPEVMKKEKQGFIEGAMKNGFSEELAEKAWEEYARRRGYTWFTGGMQTDFIATVSALIERVRAER